MHILVLTTSFPLSPDSSSGVFIERLAQELGHQCNLHVLAPAARYPVHLADEKRYQLSTFSYAPAKWQVLAQAGGGIPAALSANPWLWLLVPFFITSMLVTCFWQARRAELIFANWSICGVIAGVVGFILRRPVLTTLRGEDANRIESSGMHRLLIGLCLRMCDCVSAVSDDIAIRVQNLYPAMASKVAMIPNGVEPLPLRNNISEDTGDNSIRLLIVGSLIPRKSIQTALHALARLPAEFRLTVVGGGPERESLITLATTLGISARVHFTGHVPPNQIPEQLMKSDVLILTSRSEGRPNVVLEAMAAGLPVVGSDIPGIRELVIPSINGKLFPVADVNALVECLLPLCDRTLRRQLGEASHRMISERGLTWKNTAAIYMQQFEQLLARVQS